jgi:cytosol alanyl aminopeptidase
MPRAWDTQRMRIGVLLLAIVACSSSEHTKVPAKLGKAAEAQLPAAPGLRLPDGVTPLSYDLTLDIDPDREMFGGEVRIRVRLDRPTDHVWIHVDQIEIASARHVRAPGEPTEPLAALPVKGDQMRAFSFGRTVEAGERELAFSYTGKTTGDQEGLFRQRAGDRWYLFSQGEAVFARRITPCFDEPRFKTPWRITLVVPRMHAALANAPEQSRAADGDKQRITFAETPVMASYLLAIAVGPFDVVDAGVVGARDIPVRVAVRAGAGKQVSVVASKLPAIVDALEAYMGEPLPVQKLDLVGVPQFFGAMENPGLITFEDQILVGKDSKQRIGYFTYIAAHELAHQWFGNSLTPAWWDDLWLSESFANWLGEKITRQLGGFEEGALQPVLARREALEADAAPLAVPLRRAIRGNQDPDEAFDAIAYQKGQAVLASFEALIGVDPFRGIVRDYARTYRDRSVTTPDLVAALARATSADVGRAFEQYATQPGVPVVELALRCEGKPAVVARARDGRLVPACVRVAKTETCALVSGHTELPFTGACPALVEANVHAGYYHVQWRDRRVAAPLDKLPPAARIVAADDLAAAVHRGELPAKDAIAALSTLLDGDAHAQLAAVSLARELDTLVDDATRPAWSRWLGPRVARVDRRKPVSRDAYRVLAGCLLPADRLPRDELRKARALVDRLVTSDQQPDPSLLGIVAAKDGDALFDRIVDRARATRDAERRRDWLALLGALPPAFAEPTAALAVHKAELPVEEVWAALAAYFARPVARTAAWRALRSHLDTFTRRMPDRVTDFIEAAATLCDRSSRDEVARAFAGNSALAATLAAIDRCVQRRTRIGDLAAALAQQ